MKLKFTRQGTKAILVLAIGVVLRASQPCSAAERPEGKLNLNKIDPTGDKPLKKNKAHSGSFASHNNSSVKIYPDALKRTMHVIARENGGKEIDFFVFDLQGTLLKNYRMRPKDHYKITGLAKGYYVYRVFCGDEETAAGKFEIR